jgi:uncharacterized membrane protein
MDLLMIILRIIHILFGIFWVGTTLFLVFFFDPTIKAAGPAGGAVMGQLTLRRFTIVMGLSAFLTVAAGFVLYVKESGGFDFSWVTKPTGITLTIGSLAGILAFLLGFTVQMPAGTRMTALQKEIQAAGGQPTPSQLAEIGVLQKRLTNASRWGAALMVIAVLGMSIARELGG